MPSRSMQAVERRWEGLHRSRGWRKRGRLAFCDQKQQKINPGKRTKKLNYQKIYPAFLAQLGAWWGRQILGASHTRHQRKLCSLTNTTVKQYVCGSPSSQQNRVPKAEGREALVVCVRHSGKVSQSNFAHRSGYPYKQIHGTNLPRLLSPLAHKPCACR